MNATVPASRPPWRWLVLALGAGLCAGPPTGTARAAPQEGSVSAREALGQADELYSRTNRLLEAERLYRQALPGVRGGDCRHCFERLLAIYVLSGRQDKAIEVGQIYRDWLRRVGDGARERELALDVGRWYLDLGHYADAEPHLAVALAAGKNPLPLAQEVVAWAYRAIAAEKQGDSTGAERHWGRVEDLAARLNGVVGRLDTDERIQVVHRLSDCYRLRGRPDKACDLLTNLLPLHERVRDPLAKRDTLRRLADHLAARAERRLAGPPGPADWREAEKQQQADLRQAEQCLRQARDLHERHAAADRLIGADLASHLADVLERQGRLDEAKRWYERAMAAYQTVLEGNRVGGPQVAGALSAFLKLQTLHWRFKQYQDALKLTLDQAEQGPGGGLLESRLKADAGSLQAILSKFKEALPLLRAAVRDLEKQSPPNLIELPRILVLLGAVELRLGDAERTKQARKLGEECLAFYRKREHPLAPDLVLVDAYDLLGNCAAQDGDFRGAITWFERGIGTGKGLGRAATAAHSNLLLNIALLHKSQGDLEQALRVCKEAREVYKGFAKPGDLGFAEFDAAEAWMLAAQGEPEGIRKAYALSRPIVERYGQEGAGHRRLLAAARHCQALYYLHPPRSAFDRAEKEWRAVLDLLDPQSPLRPLTWNYLGLTEERRGRPQVAEEWYEKALRLEEGPNRRSFRVTHFITLWRLANLTARRDPKKARELLERAVGVAETARLHTYGDARRRAKYFAQFEPAFEQLVDWSAGDREVWGALEAAARGRSRTLLDQLQTAGVDLLEGVPGAEREGLRRRQREAERRIAGLRAQAQFVPDGAPEAEKARLRAAFEQAQQDYTKVYRDILDASPVYRSLSEQDFAKVRATLEERVLGPKALLLVYHIGQDKSHLLMLGGRSGEGEAFALTAPAGLAPAVCPKTLPLAAAQGRGRGLVPELAPPQPALPPSVDPDAPRIPLKQEVLRALVETYLRQVGQPRFAPTRGLEVELKGQDRPAQIRPELLAEVLLPRQARQRIRKEAPQCLVVIPDGALHKLPFEALLLRSGASPTYVLDEMPPIAYAPSVAILALLAERKQPVGEWPLSLLTVGDPAYPEKPDTRDALAMRAAKNDLLALAKLRRLRFTDLESRQIQALFEPGPVVPLRGQRATKQAVVDALHRQALRGGRHIVHIAAHGLADEASGNWFGGLALTPRQEPPTDDGLLRLDEIYGLPLKDCELAVLSACETNVGPQEPLEAGVTLASGFLAAGAHRVVASHWWVDDASTAELMVAFFREVTDTARKGGRVPYPLALQKARREVRKQTQWSAPFHWAPFVLVGPPD
jgi:CHAT domain-containing protein/tetratricopeptide (TPR) repeat protein